MDDLFPQVLIQHHHNPGVKYEYLLPINTSQGPSSDEEGELELFRKSINLLTTFSHILDTHQRPLVPK